MRRFNEVGRAIEVNKGCMDGREVVGLSVSEVCVMAFQLLEVEVEEVFHFKVGP